MMIGGNVITIFNGVVTRGRVTYICKRSIVIINAQNDSNNFMPEDIPNFLALGPGFDVRRIYLYRQ